MSKNINENKGYKQAKHTIFSNSIKNRLKTVLGSQEFSPEPSSQMPCQAKNSQQENPKRKIPVPKGIIPS